MRVDQFVNFALFAPRARTQSSSGARFLGDPVERLIRFIGKRLFDAQLSLFRR